MPTLTPWFPADAKPARPGVYQRWSPYAGIVYSRWDGRQWFFCNRSADLAAQDMQPSLQLNLAWRGITRV